MESFDGSPSRSGSSTGGYDYCLWQASHWWVLICLLKILEELDFFSTSGNFSHTLPPANLIVSIPRPVVFAFGGCSFLEHLIL